MSYSISSIHINNREIELEAILSDSIVPLSNFESETLSFIKAWITGIDLFNLNTSGSTGVPKKITLTRHQLKQSAHRTIKALGLTPNETALVCLDTKYVAGKMMLVRALENNMRIIAVEPSSNPIQNLAKETSVDFAAFVPMQLQEILKNNESSIVFNKIKTTIIGGAALSAPTELELQKVSSTVYATYGMTETVSHIALQRLNGEGRNDYFTILPDIQIEKDERGCLVIHMPEFVEKIVTNDLVELINAENFRWLGRWDSVINSGGFKVSPEKVEHVLDKILESLAIHKPFFVSGVPDETLGQQVVLVMEGNPLPLETESLLTRQLQDTLHPYEIPKKIFYNPQFILTETGKIDRIRTILNIQ